MKRRYKLLLIIFISFLMVVIIYFLFFKPQKYYFAIKENNHLNLYEYNDYFTDNNQKYKYIEYTNNYFQSEELLDLVKNNSKFIHNIKKASLVTIDLKTKELANYNNLSSEIVNDYLDNLDIILKEINKLNSDIIFIDSYNNDLLNQKVKQLCNKYKVIYIGPKVLDKYKIILDNETIINYKGQEKIYKIILKNIDK